MSLSLSPPTSVWKSSYDGDWRYCDRVSSRLRMEKLRERRPSSMVFPLKLRLRHFSPRVHVRNASPARITAAARSQSFRSAPARDAQPYIHAMFSFRTCSVLICGLRRRRRSFCHFSQMRYVPRSVSEGIASRAHPKFRRFALPRLDGVWCLCGQTSRLPHRRHYVTIGSTQHHLFIIFRGASIQLFCRRSCF